MKLKAILLLLILPLFAYSEQYKTIPIQINRHKLTAEVCDTLPLQIKGLQGHTSLTENNGMLFVYDSDAIRTFWMKDMAFPIDIIWIDKSQHVVDISANVPPCHAEPCTLYRPQQTIRYVLEVKAQLAKKWHITSGTTVHFDIQQANRITDTA